MTSVFLGVVPGALLVAGIAGRLPAPVVSDESFTVLANGQWTAPIASLGSIWEGLGLHASLKRDDDRAALIVDIVDPPLKPDLLLYWIPAAAEMRTSVDSVSAATQLPATAVFLGALKETRQAIVDLPPRTLEGEGRIVLYSLPYREVVSVSIPVNFN